MKKEFNDLKDQKSLLPRWLALWQRLGIENADLTTAGQQIIAHYAEGSRSYHTQEHLTAVLTELDWAKEGLKKSGELLTLSARAQQNIFDTIELALWYHDAIYDAEAEDNEAKSRDLFLSHAKKFGLAVILQNDIAHLIDITAHHKDAKTLMERIITDCDLAILGAKTPAFRQYDANIRKEYAHVPASTYKTARRGVLKGFLEQRSIFKTKAFRQKLKSQARKNLSSAVKYQPSTKKIRD